MSNNKKPWDELTPEEQDAVAAAELGIDGVHIVYAHKDASIPDNSHDTGRCPKCAGETTEGFGLAGGGYGPYTYCEACGIIVTKTDEPIDASNDRPEA